MQGSAKSTSSQNQDFEAVTDIWSKKWQHLQGLLRFQGGGKYKDGSGLEAGLWGAECIQGARCPEDSFVDGAVTFAHDYCGWQRGRINGGAQVGAEGDRALHCRILPAPLRLRRRHTLVPVICIVAWDLWHGRRAGICGIQTA
jgi:hypothetical protein